MSSEIYEKICDGDILAVQSYGFFGRAIRRAETIWLRRILANIGENELAQIDVALWNHIGILYRKKEKWLIGESVAKGNVENFLMDYVKLETQGKMKLWVLRPKELTRDDCATAASNFSTYILGRPYDFLAYVRLAIKSFISNIFPNSTAGCKYSFYCSEAVEEAYKINPPGISLTQDANPTPMHFQLATVGLSPQRPDRKKTLEIIYHS